MNIDALVVTTNRNDRLSFLSNVINSIERFNIFDNKILSVDIIKDEVSINYFKLYSDMGWNIIAGESKGLANNQTRGLSEITSEYMLYSEDKVIINKIPSKEVIPYIFDYIKYLCYNMHIECDFVSPKQQSIDFINNKDNYKTIFNDTILIKKPELYDDYYLNFPVVLAPTKNFKEIHTHARTKFPDTPIEVAMSKAWQDKYHMSGIGIYVKNDVFLHIPMNLMDFFHMANMQYWNNDPHLRPPSIVEANGRQDADYILRKKVLEEYE